RASNPASGLRDRDRAASASRILHQPTPTARHAGSQSSRSLPLTRSAGAAVQRCSKSVTLCVRASPNWKPPWESLSDRSSGGTRTRTTAKLPTGAITRSTYRRRPIMADRHVHDAMGDTPPYPRMTPDEARKAAASGGEADALARDIEGKFTAI